MPTKKRHGAVLGVQEVPHHEVNRYGIVSPRTISAGLHRVEGLVEKPAPADAPSNLAVIGRYVLPPSIFTHLKNTERGVGGEIQLTDALARLMETEGLIGYRFEGTRHDAGDKLGYVKANIAYALKRPELKDGLMKYIRELAAGGK